MFPPIKEIAATILKEYNNYRKEILVDAHYIKKEIRELEYEFSDIIEYGVCNESELTEGEFYFITIEPK